MKKQITVYSFEINNLNHKIYGSMLKNDGVYVNENYKKVRVIIEVLE